MSKELAPTRCDSGKVSNTQYWGGIYRGRMLQMTFNNPEYEQGKPLRWYLQVNQSQARDMAATLLAFAEEQKNDE